MIVQAGLQQASHPQLSLPPQAIVLEDKVLGFLQLTTAQPSSPLPIIVLAMLFGLTGLGLCMGLYFGRTHSPMPVIIPQAPATQAEQTTGTADNLPTAALVVTFHHLQALHEHVSASVREGYRKEAEQVLQQVLRLYEGAVLTTMGQQLIIYYRDKDIVEALNQALCSAYLLNRYHNRHSPIVRLECRVVDCGDCHQAPLGRLLVSTHKEDKAAIGRLSLDCTADTAAALSKQVVVDTSTTSPFVINDFVDSYRSLLDNQLTHLLND